MISFLPRYVVWLVLSFGSLDDCLKRGVRSPATSAAHPTRGPSSRSQASSASSILNEFWGHEGRTCHQVTFNHISGASEPFCMETWCCGYRVRNLRRVDALVQAFMHKRICTKDYVCSRYPKHIPASMELSLAFAVKLLLNT